MNKEDILNKIMALPDEGVTGICKLCPDGQGYILKEDDIAELCSCAKNKRLHRLYESVGIPPAYFDKNLSHWNLKQDVYGQDLGPNTVAKKHAYEFMRKYLKVLPALCAGYGIKINQKRGASIYTREYLSVLFHGGPRSGKTLLSAIAIQNAARKGYKCKMYNYTNDLRPYLSNFDDSDKQNELAKEFKTLDLIAIDGISFYEGNSNRSLPVQIDRLVNIRTDSNKPTIITCKNDCRSVEYYDNWRSLFDTCYIIKLPSMDNHN